MQYLVLMCIAGLSDIVKSYENLSRRKTSTVSQSSTFVSDTNFMYNATLAIDGQTKTSDSYCGQTANDQSIAWLQVDLGTSYSIYRVKLFYRNDEGIWRPYRFRQFHLDVSDVPVTESTTLNRTRCYTDNTSVPQIPSSEISIPCQKVARYVIVETTYDAPEDNPVKGAILELCEIEIYGCEIGRYGNNCLSCQRCQMCNIESGKCECNSTHFGPSCSQECSDQCTRKSCNDAGSCHYGCNTGYFGNECNIACDTCPAGCDRTTGRCTGDCLVGKYGFSCDKNCNVYCRNGCDKTLGICKECVGGKMGTFCNISCSDDCVYGCDQTTGKCSDPPEWEDDGARDTNVIYNSCPNNQFMMFVVPAFLFISLAVNVFTITWIICPDKFKRREKANTDKDHSPSNDIMLESTMFEPAEDNAGYQELGYVSGPSQYEELQVDYLEPCSSLSSI